MYANALQLKLDQNPTNIVVGLLINNCFDEDAT